MFSSISIQNAKLISATVYDQLQSAPLILRFEKGDAWGEFTLHTENAKFSVAMAEAINKVIADFAADTSMEAPEMRDEEFSDVNQL